MMPSFKPSRFANAEVEKISFPNYKKNYADHKKPIPHHLGRYLLNNDTFVRDGAVTVDIEQI